MQPISVISIVGNTYVPSATIFLVGGYFTNIEFIVLANAKYCLMRYRAFLNNSNAIFLKDPTLSLLIKESTNFIYRDMQYSCRLLLVWKYHMYCILPHIHLIKESVIVL